MKRRTFQSGLALRWALFVLIGTAIACSSEVSFNPVEPDFPNWPTGLGRSLEISGTLTAEQGTCLEATVLYDGVELKGARAVCQRASGCTRLALSAFTESSAGDHTISFKVLRQSSTVVRYRAAGTVRVSRDGVFLGGVTLPLGPNAAKLEAGDSVSFDVSFRN